MTLFTALRAVFEHSQRQRKPCSSTDFLDYVKAHFEDVCDDVVESTILDQNNQVLSCPSSIVVLHNASGFSKKILHLNRHSDLIAHVKASCAELEKAKLDDILDIMWSSGHWPSPSKSLHPTCLMCGRLVCGPHKQMVQQVLSDRPLQSLADGERCLKLNPERLCRRISDPWMLESVQISLCCPWEACETEALVMMVKKVGYLGWDAVKEHLEERGIIRTSDQCQHHWREIYQTEANQESSMRTLVNRSLGDRWRKRDESIAAEFEAVLSERDEGSDVAAVGVHELGGGLIMWAPLLACYLSPRQTLARPPASLLPEMIQEDFLIGLSAFFRTPLIDRTGVLNQDCCLGLAVLDPLPKKDPSFCKDLATIMDERAHSLLALARSSNCKLEVLWSGGIDSTSLLIALLQALHPHWSPLRESALEQGANELIVRCSADSIAEYPWFHENVLLKLAELGGICLEPLADSEEVLCLRGDRY